MLITPANLQVFFTSLETRFYTALGTVPVRYERIATTYPVNTEVWLSGWTDMIDKMRLWSGPRVTHNPAPITYQVPIQNFELTESIDLFKLQDDQHGIYAPTVSYMAMQAAKWPDYQIRDLLQNAGAWTGGYQNGYDNLTFFNTAHNVDFYDSSKGTYCNDFTGGGVTVNGTTVGGGLALNSFWTVWEDLAARKNASGEAWGVQPDLAMAGPRLKATLDTLLQAQFLGAPVIGNIGTQATASGFPSAVAAVPNQYNVGASENVAKGLTDRLIWEDLGGAGSLGSTSVADNVWYMLDTTKPVRPISWLLRQAPDFVARVNPDDPIVFDTHQIAYGSKGRGAPAWGFHALMSRSGS